jgi:cytochrome c peroxidase
VALSEAEQRGRLLFHGASDARISSDGRACASCHPDGRDDGLTWPTPHGARQTPMLAGRLSETTQPYGWQGDTATIGEHVTQTFQRLGGKGLNESEMNDLLAYLHAMDTPKSDESPDSKLVARGRELFHAETVGCATCHTHEGVGSDGARHNVGGGAEVETPSLRLVAGTGPYFHDGRFATLGDMLRETKGKMGWAGDMNDGVASLNAPFDGECPN